MPRPDYAGVMSRRIAANGGDYMGGAYFAPEDYVALEAQGATHSDTKAWEERWRARNPELEQRSLSLRISEVTDEVRKFIIIVF